MMLFSTACAMDKKYDLDDYKKLDRDIENSRTFLKNGEYSKNMNIHPETYKKRYGGSSKC